MNQYLELRVTNSNKWGKSRRVTQIINPLVRKPIEIFHEFDRVISFSNDTILDGHVFVVLLYAASQKLPLRVHGNISISGLRNMREIQLAWRRWKPELYDCVEIIPDKIIENYHVPTNPKAVSAFSGGVDATFTAISHTKNLPQNIRYPLKSVLMVNGFDVDLGNNADFKSLINRVTPLLEELHLELRTIRTNSRELRIQNWYDSSALEIAGCMHMLYEEFSYGLIGSGNSYESIAIPSGSTPMLDHLISNNFMNLIHDGAGFTRTEKVAEIIKYPTARKSVKVCWAGANQSKNCGKCEKCVRTRLNFLLAGCENPECFDGELDADLIENLYIENHCQMNEMRSVLGQAKRKNISAKWVEALEQFISGWQPADEKTVQRRRYGSPTKNFVVRIADSAGVRAPLQAVWRYSRRKIMGLIE